MKYSWDQLLSLWPTGEPDLAAQARDVQEAAAAFTDKVVVHCSDDNEGDDAMHDVFFDRMSDIVAEAQVVKRFVSSCIHCDPIDFDGEVYEANQATGQMFADFVQRAITCVYDNMSMKVFVVLARWL